MAEVADTAKTANRGKLSHLPSKSTSPCMDEVIRINMSWPNAIAVIKSFPVIGATASATANAAGMIAPLGWVGPS